MVYYNIKINKQESSAKTVDLTSKNTLRRLPLQLTKQNKYYYILLYKLA